MKDGLGFEWHERGKCVACSRATSEASSGYIMRGYEKNKKNEVVIYQAKNGAIELRHDLEKGTIWATQAQMAAVFDVNPQAVTKHLQNIYVENELSEKATCSKVEQVQKEGNRLVKRFVDSYNLEAIISVGYRINSKTGTRFRQWATKTLRQHITKGYSINPKVIKNNYAEFQKAIDNIKHLFPVGAPIDHANVLELISAFADTRLSLDAYDKDELDVKGTTKKSVTFTGEHLQTALLDFKKSLMKKRQATELFGNERNTGSVLGIFGNVMQSFGVEPVIFELCFNTR
ncbi:MAG: death-on-curing family protein [Candidatus Magasanikbacteria bacterium]|nr:death-on-curing family protein [Candidatus Magasanikbacteria bacterium]